MGWWVNFRQQYLRRVYLMGETHALVSARDEIGIEMATAANDCDGAVRTG